MINIVNISRYSGVRPFEKKQNHLFFGRKKDIKALCRIIKSNHITTLYGKSSVGKSSLINAGVIPKIVEEGHFEPIVVRLKSFNKGDNTNITPFESTKKAINDENQSEKTFLDKIIKDEDSLWHCVKEHSLRQDGERGLLLIFDQFEELFTYDELAVNIFQEQLAEALQPNLPQRYLDVIKSEQEKDSAFMSAEEQQLIEKAPQLKILISIRTEKLHSLNNLNAFLPNIFKNNYELDVLDEQSATDAIVLPASLPNTEGIYDTEPFTFEPSALNSILDFLTQNGTEKIESTQLQIICNAIEENILRENTNLVRNEDIGDLKPIIGNFYKECIENLDSAEQIPARLLIEDNLILEKEERRLNLYEGKALQFVSAKTLASLVDSHLLRAEPSIQGGYSYELSHSNLVKPILQAFPKRVKSQQEAEKDRLTVMRVMEVLESKRIADLERKKRRRSNIITSISLFAFLITVVWWWFSDANAKKALSNSNSLTAKDEPSNSTMKGKDVANSQNLLDSDSTLNMRMKEFENLRLMNQNMNEATPATTAAGVDQQKDFSNYIQQATNSQLEELIKKQDKTLSQLSEKEQEVLSAYQIKAQAEQEAQQARLELERKTQEAEQLKNDLIAAKEVKTTANEASLKQIERELSQANLELQQARKEVANRDTELKRLRTSSAPKSLESNMVFVKGGTFTMGFTIEQGNDSEANEKPAHSVALSDFYIGKYEVTQKEWREVMGNNPRELKFKGCDQCPVENVSWDDIQVFLQKLNLLSDRKYRLPTEAEWEYAARGGNQSKGYKYSGGDNISEVSWYNGRNSADKTYVIGTKKPNELGIYDMSGNVWEWCHDLYSDYNSSTAIVNAKSIGSKDAYRVLRGGSWFSKANFCRVSFRNLNMPSVHSNNLGFRLAFSPLGRG